jgi:hypothetical protein
MIHFRTIDSPIGPLALAGHGQVLTHLRMLNETFEPPRSDWVPDDGAFSDVVDQLGLANGRNPIAIVVPCHRVIGASGSLTGYGGGLIENGGCSTWSDRGRARHRPFSMSAWPRARVARRRSSSRAAAGATGPQADRTAGPPARPPGYLRG